MILLVEDDQSHAELIRRAFAQRAPDHDLIVVGSVAAAQEYAHDPRLELVIADLMLPDGSGLQLLPGELTTAEHPIILMTSHGSEEVAVEAMKAGALDYVVKTQESLEDMPHLAMGAMREWNLIVEKRELESRILEAQKLAAIGTLAGGVAHDFNNLLMGIQGDASLMLMDVGEESPHYERLKSIEELVRSGADLTRQLLGFARAGKYEVTAVDMVALVLETSELFGRTKRTVRIHRDFQSESGWVRGDRSQLHQVLLNLYLNAWQAMPAGGDLYLEIETVSLDQEKVGLFQGKPGSYLRIVVRDTGVGIPPENQPRVFEPFYSTKGAGSGLGLSSTYGIIKGHDGHIEVRSALGAGSTFELLLPTTTPPEPRERTTEETSDGGAGTLLLVDDEPAVLKVGTALLRRLGYEVYPAASGEEAITLFQKHRAEIDLVILDMIMPDLPGTAVAARLQQTDPSVRILLCSGYALDNDAEALLAAGCVGFMQKPFDMETLSQRVRASIEHKGP
jgi:two-component system, cell cycle sensor histidine kinase and response regulator CckA